MTTAFITGLSGEELSPAEKSFLRSAAPCGLILFSRNCRDHEQIRTLVAAAKEAIGSADILVLIDQ
jgi:beta-N-acetylhexosaminidase